jgi:hypothetical protein
LINPTHRFASGDGEEIISSSEAGVRDPWLFRYLLSEDDDRVGEENQDTEEPALRPIITARLFGILGALMSALIATTAQERIPSEWERGLLLLARPVIGATSGLLALLSAYTGLFTTNRPAAVEVLAFVFGFSKRLVVETVERLTEHQGTVRRRRGGDDDVP